MDKDVIVVRNRPTPRDLKEAREKERIVLMPVPYRDFRDDAEQQAFLDGLLLGLGVGPNRRLFLLPIPPGVPETEYIDRWVERILNPASGGPFFEGGFWKIPGEPTGTFGTPVVWVKPVGGEETP